MKILLLRENIETQNTVVKYFVAIGHAFNHWRVGLFTPTVGLGIARGHEIFRNCVNSVNMFSLNIRLFNLKVIYKRNALF